MTREEAIKEIRNVFVEDFAGEIIKALKQEDTCEMTAEEYRQRMIQAFYNADCVELIFACVFPTEKEFEHLEWWLKNNYKKESCEDCISRKNTLAEFKRVYFDNDAVIRCAELVLGSMPSVTSQPKTGHWITTRTFMHDGEFYCDKCKCDSPNNEKWDYCPNCGVKMEEVEDENK